MSEITVTRFAPSPNGYLHLGHAYAALMAYEMAETAGGRFLLRMEDIDSSRCRSEFETAIIEDLEWLGLEWNGPIMRQSNRFDAYRRALSELDDMGVTYPCFCTRKDIAAEIARSAKAPHGPEGPLYPGTCRALTDEAAAREKAAETPYAIRLNVARALKLAGALTWHDRDAGAIAARPERLGDVVLARKDIPTSYHLAVVVDDDAQGITTVTRGRDLFETTHIHCLLYALLGMQPPRYWHHPLVLDDDGRRLSKRDRDMSLRALRAAGHTPADIKRLTAARSGPPRKAG